ncbi:MAG: DUF4345 domain-containing protein [Pseudohongiellaceae bacterium]
MNKLINSLLHLNGWVAVLIGVFIVIEPISMLSPYGLQTELSNSLLSELRAPGGMLIVCGLTIVHSAVVPHFRERGLYLSAMVYGSYAGGRLLSIFLDGIPQIEILSALAIELTLCGLSLVAIGNSRDNPALSAAS